jgi:hypothetical protein
VQGPRRTTAAQLKGDPIMVDQSKNAYNFNLNLTGQADRGGKEAAEKIEELFEDFIVELDKAGIPVQGTLTGNIQPALADDGSTVLGDRVIHSAASDVLLAAKSKADAKREQAKAKESRGADPRTDVEQKKGDPPRPLDKNEAAARGQRPKPRAATKAKAEPKVKTGTVTTNTAAAPKSA